MAKNNKSTIDNDIDKSHISDAMNNILNDLQVMKNEYAKGDDSELYLGMYLGVKESIEVVKNIPYLHKFHKYENKNFNFSTI